MYIQLNSTKKHTIAIKNVFYIQINHMISYNIVKLEISLG